MNQQTIEGLADCFATVLHDWLTDSQWRVMRKLNVRNIETSICASHDFCDANMAMMEAFERVLGREPDINADADIALWDAAWILARTRYLTA